MSSNLRSFERCAVLRQRALGLAVCVIATVSLPAHGAGTPDVPVRIELRPQAAITGASVSLGDIAGIACTNAPLLQRLTTLSLGQAPRVGESATVDREALMRWIHAHTGIDAHQVVWSGAASTGVRRATQVVMGERAALSALQMLQAELRQIGLRSELQAVQSPQDLTLPVGRVEFKPRPLAMLDNAAASIQATGHLSSPSFAKRQSVWVDVWVDGRFIRTVPVSFEVSVFGPAYVAEHPLASGMTLDPGHMDANNLTVREVEWSGRGALPISVPTILPGTEDAKNGSPLAAATPLRLRHPVAAGQPVTRADVEAVSLVTRGEYATLRSVHGPIELESRVEVLQDGGPGQTVRVKLANASSAILARVTGPGTVEIRQ